MDAHTATYAQFVRTVTEESGRLRAQAFTFLTVTSGDRCSKPTDQRWVQPMNRTRTMTERYGWLQPAGCSGTSAAVRLSGCPRSRSFFHRSNKWWTGATLAACRVNRRAPTTRWEHLRDSAGAIGSRSLWTGTAIDGSAMVRTGSH